MACNKTLPLQFSSAMITIFLIISCYSCENDACIYDHPQLTREEISDIKLQISKLPH